jgi:hypothetical protein
MDSSGMKRRRAYCSIPVAAIEFDSKQDIGRFGPPIRLQLFIGRMLIIGIGEIDVRKAMPRRCHHHHTATGADQAGKAIDQ